MTKPQQDDLPIMHYRIEDDQVIQWYEADGERVEFPPFAPGPNWKRWVDGEPMCVTWANGYDVFRLEKEK